MSQALSASLSSNPAWSAPMAIVETTRPRYAWYGLAVKDTATCGAFPAGSLLCGMLRPLPRSNDETNDQGTALGRRGGFDLPSRPRRSLRRRQSEMPREHVIDVPSIVMKGTIPRQVKGGKIALAVTLPWPSTVPQPWAAGGVPPNGQST